MAARRHAILITLGGNRPKVGYLASVAAEEVRIQRGAGGVERWGCRAERCRGAEAGEKGGRRRAEVMRGG
jgi:hypothetical protein